MLDGFIFDMVYFDLFVDIYYFDKWFFVGGDGVVYCSLVVDMFLVVCDCFFCVLFGILGVVLVCVCGWGGKRDICWEMRV